MFWSYNLYMVHLGDCSSTSASRMSRPMSGSKTHGENTWWKHMVKTHGENTWWKHMVKTPHFPQWQWCGQDVQSCSISSHNGPSWCVKPPSLWGNLTSYPWKKHGNGWEIIPDPVLEALDCARTTRYWSSNTNIKELIMDIRSYVYIDIMFVNLAILWVFTRYWEFWVCEHFEHPHICRSGWSVR